MNRNKHKQDLKKKLKISLRDCSKGDGRVRKRHSKTSNLKLKTKCAENEAEVQTSNINENNIHERLYRSTNKCDAASLLFKWLIHPMEEENFYETIWEKRPLLLSRKTPLYNSCWFSSRDLDEILKKHNLQYGINVDITSFENEVRETHNQEGRAIASVVWDYYNTGCSVRLLNPQTYSDKVWKLLSTLQEHFSCFVGANVYLTPPGTQGFAPHWDDIEAFVLQLEGAKRWRVYAPRSNNEILPTYSSKNFTSEDLTSEPIIDTVLRAGDMLYFPRGFIHQAEALNSTHSLHITVSTAQNHSWKQLLEKMFTQALKDSIEEEIVLRTSLPSDLFMLCGNYSNAPKTKTKEMKNQVKSMLSRVVDHVDIDSAVDRQSLDFLHQSLPPYLAQNEKSCSVFSTSGFIDKSGKVIGSKTLEVTSKIRLVSLRCFRIVNSLEDDSPVLVYSTDNSRIYKQYEIREIPLIEEHQVKNIVFLKEKFPSFSSIQDFPEGGESEKLELAIALFERCIVLVEKPTSLVNI